MSFKFVDLFAGIGGFHHALTSPEFGGELALACDIDETCRSVYRSTWPELPDAAVTGDLRQITRNSDGSDASRRKIQNKIPRHEVLCAGFPCQPFSKSGSQLGTRDSTRGTLFFDILQVIRARHPEFLILENVRNLAGPRHADTWKTIVDLLRKEGYRVADKPVVMSPHFLAPSDGGTPQVRDRVFVLARLARENEVLNPQPLLRRGPIAGWNPKDWRIEDILESDSAIRDIDRYKLRREEIAWVNAWNAFAQGIEADDLPGFPIWHETFTPRFRTPTPVPFWKKEILERNRDFYRENRAFIEDWKKRNWIRGAQYSIADFPASRRKLEWQAREAQPKRHDRDLWKLSLQFRPSGIRVRPMTYLPALVAITQTSIIGSRCRRITPIEACRLQGIPDQVFHNAGVDDVTAYRQLGNAVNVGVVKYLARLLFADAGKSWGTS